MKKADLLGVALVLLLAVIFLALLGSLKKEGFANGYSSSYVAPTEEFPVVLYSAPNYEGEAFQLRVGKHIFKDVFPAGVPRPDHKRWIRSIQMLPGATFEYRNAIGGIQDAVYTANRAVIKFRLDNLRNRNGVTDSVTVTYTKTASSTNSNPVLTQKTKEKEVSRPVEYDINGSWYHGFVQVTMGNDGTGSFVMDTMRGFMSQPSTLVTKVGPNKYLFKTSEFSSYYGTMVGPDRIEFEPAPGTKPYRVFDVWERFTTPKEFPLDGKWGQQTNEGVTIIRMNADGIVGTVYNTNNSEIGTVTKEGLNKYTLRYAWQNRNENSQTLQLYTPDMLLIDYSGNGTNLDVWVKK